MSKREIYFQRADIMVHDKNYTIEQKHLTEIFTFGTQPYIVVGSSGGGKTTLCMDIIYKLAKECTNIYYVTATVDSMSDDSISQIPRAYRRTPTFDNLHNIWKEVKRNYESYAPNDDNLKKTFTEVFALAKRSDAAQIISKLQARKQQIMSERLNYYKQQKIEQSESMKLANNDSKAFYVDTLSKLIVAFAKDIEIDRLSNSSKAIVTAIVSTPPKTLLLLDDVSSEMNNLKTASMKKVQYNGAATKISDAYKSLLLDILTKGRHFNAIICLFLHTIELIPDKSLINNIIVFNKEVVQKICMAKTFTDDTKAILQEASSRVFTEDHKYCFFHLNLMKNTMGVCKADLHYSEELTLSPMNQRFINAYNAIYAGGEAANIKPESDEYSYSEDEVITGSAGGGELDQFTID